MWKLHFAIFFYAFGFLLAAPVGALACCPAPPSGKPVVNADQTVLIIWDAAHKTQHFIRRATFTSEADDFGFLIPSPKKPALAESGNEVFPFLFKLTEPETVTRPRPPQFSCACGEAAKGVKSAGSLRILDQKLVAGFQATVLETDSSAALIDWLKGNGYSYSPAVEAWAAPYVKAGWKITALKVAKSPDKKDEERVAASALRLSFKTDQPLFPYREPDNRRDAETLHAGRRLLRIYFLANARYEGKIEGGHRWSGQTAWAGELGKADSTQALRLADVSMDGPHDPWWLTEFEDDWAYDIAPGDVYFSPAESQTAVERPPIVEYVAEPIPPEGALFAVAALVAWPVYRRMRQARIAMLSCSSEYVDRGVFSHARGA